MDTMMRRAAGKRPMRPVRPKSWGSMMRRLDMMRHLVIAVVMAVCVVFAPVSSAAAASDAGPPEIRVLLRAAAANRIDILFRLLDKGIDADATDPRGNTGLIAAAGNRARAAAGLLLTRGADVNRANARGWTPLMAAALRGDVPMMRLLLDHKADPALREKRYGRGALHVAALGSSAQIVALLLDAGADVDMADTKDGLTPLILSLANRSPKAAQIAVQLLEAGARINGAAADGFTPLMAAVRSRKTLMVKFLLSRGARHQPAARDGRTAVSIAAAAGSLDLVRLLAGEGADLDGREGVMTPLSEAVRARSGELVAWLLSRAVRPNAPGRSGKRPLVLAAGSRQMDMVEALLRAGADVNLANVADGTTALMWAANAGDFAMVKRLMRAGARVSLRAKDGWDPIKAAEMAGHDEIAAYLREQI